MLPVIETQTDDFGRLTGRQQFNFAEFIASAVGGEIDLAGIRISKWAAPVTLDNLVFDYSVFGLTLNRETRDLQNLPLLKEIEINLRYAAIIPHHPRLTCEICYIIMPCR